MKGEGRKREQNTKKERNEVIEKRGLKREEKTERVIELERDRERDRERERERESKSMREYGASELVRSERGVQAKTDRRFSDCGGRINSTPQVRPA